MFGTKRTQVIIVDDSAVIRNALRVGLSRDPRIEVVGAAGDAYRARDLIVERQPDIITLDLEMPRMHGLEFIKVLMQHWPLPIVVISSVADASREISMKALELGAVEIFPKPKPEDAVGLKRQIARLADLLVLTAKAPINLKSATPKPSLRLTPASHTPTKSDEDKVIVIGASTGGTEAIRKVLERLPAGLPGIVMVQHMPEGFTQSFADRLNQICSHLTVKEARNGDPVLPSSALLAPGNKHMLLKRKPGGGYYVEVKNGPPVNRHRPSVEVLFHSAAEVAGKNAIGVILTGMGADGAKGLLEMRNAGARTIAQNEATCVVYGMPREAVELGAAEKVLPIEQVAQWIGRFLH